MASDEQLRARVTRDTVVFSVGSCGGVRGAESQIQGARESGTWLVCWNRSNPGVFLSVHSSPLPFPPQLQKEKIEHDATREQLLREEEEHDKLRSSACAAALRVQGCILWRVLCGWAWVASMVQ